MIFISYRRSDGKSTAKLIQKSLIVEYGFDKDDIFLDLHSIISDNFVEKCQAAITSCDKFILLITKDSFIRRDGVDHYWNEIRQALDEHKKIIPVLFDTTFDENSLPQEFRDKNLHLKHAIRFDIEFINDSMEHLVKALIDNTPTSYIKKIAGFLAIPSLFISLYLCVSLLGGVVRYIWDNHWLSDETCREIAKQHIVYEGDNIYSYATQDTIYFFNCIDKTIKREYNPYKTAPRGVSIHLNKTDAYQAGFWAMAIGLVREVGAVKIKPHGNPKVIGIGIIAAVSVAAGFGFGFVCERMIFPVQESRIIRGKLADPEWWGDITPVQRLNKIF